MDDVEAGTAGNLLLVGGPCANPAVEAASSEFPTCADWPLEVGEGLIQLVEQADGSVALLVAGTSAKDTRVATQVVAKMDKLQALDEGVMKQKVEQVTGELTEMVEVVEEAMEEDTGEEEAMEEDDSMTEEDTGATE
ncbi:hypothetical protein GF323_00005 [Candidatus Woesearchaeota archaeon]|nr:hypothetical protein [Candidatus Woesearchaeota archaeon]